MEGNNSEEKRAMPAWWSGSIVFFAKASAWIGGPVILALLIGKRLDAHFKSAPWIFLSLTAFAFIISIFGIIKMTVKYLNEISKEEKKTKEQK